MKNLTDVTPIETFFFKWLSIGCSMSYLKKNLAHELFLKLADENSKNNKAYAL